MESQCSNSLDQYSDGKAAKVWELYMGNKEKRTEGYSAWFVNVLRSHGVRTVLDVACGTGVDSVMLLEAGFEVVSCDISDKMLKYALRERWEKRKQPAYDRWIITEANWLTLQEDLESVKGGCPKEGFDAVICVGNSFAHLPDFDGQLSAQKQALHQFATMLRPGGILLIDHRNYDAMLDTGKAPDGYNVYYSGKSIVSIECSNTFVDGQPRKTELHYTMDVRPLMSAQDLKRLEQLQEEEKIARSTLKFNLSYYPHRRERFEKLLWESLGNKITHQVVGDFQELSADYTPAYFIHTVQKSKELQENGFGSVGVHEAKRCSESQNGELHQKSQDANRKVGVKCQ